MTRSNRLVACLSDQRAVSSVIGFILLFGLLVMLLAMYQAQIVPQQNAQAEFQHNQEVQDDLIDLRNAISTAGQADKPTFTRINLGPTYETRVAAINPPPAAGTLRTSPSYNITISNRTAEYDTNVSTRFVEYEPGYNEITTGSIWYEHSVLYVDERNERPVQILEDQNLLTEQSQKVRLTALQNEFETTGTERTKIELYPTETVNDSDIPTGELDVIIPTRLNKSEYWAEQLGDEITVQEDFHADGVHRLNMSNSTVHSDNLEFNTVGLREIPLGEQPKQNVGPAGQRSTGDDETGDGDTGDDTGDDDNGEDDNGEDDNGDDDDDPPGQQEDTISADSINDISKNSENEIQKFTFTLESRTNNEVTIDVSEPNSAGVDYEGGEIQASGDNTAEFRNDDETLVFDPSGNKDGEQSITVTELNVEDINTQKFDSITFTRTDSGNANTASFEIIDSDDEEVEDASVFVSADEEFGNNDEIDTRFTVTDGEQTFEFSVNINEQGNDFRSQEISINGENFELEDDARDAIVDGTKTDILDADNFDAPQSELDEIRNDITTDYLTVDQQDDGVRLTTEVQSIE